MRIYGNAEDLPQDVAQKVQILIDKISKSNYSGEMALYYGYPFIELDGKDTIMKSCIICSKGIIFLYDEEAEKEVYKRHLMKIMLESQELSKFMSIIDKVLLGIHIEQQDTVIDILEGEEDLFTEYHFRETNAVMQNMYGINHSDEREVSNENTLGALIKERNNEINMLDQNQFEAIYKKTTSHTRIRGLAGSGKTILLVKKMAYMHYKNRDLELAYVFYTKSLKQYIKDLFINFYRDFEKYKEPDMNKIHILHSWGGNEMEGFYSRVCKENEVASEAFYEISGTNKFNKACWNLLNKLEDRGKSMYDFVFVDEAQDFSLGFFKLVLSTLKNNGKMIYAYDELQSLNDDLESMPDKKSIFGEEECEDINLSICYRTPKRILVSAHALGLGIYRKNNEGESNIVNMMQDYSIWSAVGYDTLEGELGYGKKVVLGRKEIISKVPQKCVEIKAVECETMQYEKVCDEIHRLIKEEDVLPEDILIIDLAGIGFQSDFGVFKQVFSEKFSDETEVISKVHLVNKENALKFKREGSVPYTTIFRAKGNEANIVFIVNTQKMSSMQTFARNRLFTAMTRAKFKVYIYGVQGSAMDTLLEEFREVKEKKFTLDFVYPSEEQLKTMRTIARTEAKNVDTMEKAYKSLKDNKDLTIEILKEQVGAVSMEELIAKLQEYSKNE